MSKQEVVTLESLEQDKDIDLDDLDVRVRAERGFKLGLKHPGTGLALKDKKGVQYYIDMRGFDASEIRDLEQRFADRQLDAQRKNKDTSDIRDRERETIAKLNAATIGWYLPPIKGQDLPYNHENGKKVYGNPGLIWIPEQMLDAARDRSRLFTVASTN